jgi:hypothetical protein
MLAKDKTGMGPSIEFEACQQNFQKTTVNLKFRIAVFAERDHYPTKAR